MTYLVKARPDEYRKVKEHLKGITSNIRRYATNRIPLDYSNLDFKLKYNRKSRRIGIFLKKDGVEKLVSKDYEGDESEKVFAEIIHQLIVDRLDLSRYMALIPFRKEGGEYFQGYIDNLAREHRKMLKNKRRGSE